MDDYPNSLRTEALRILEVLNGLEFDNCVPLTREFNELPPRPGIYAVKHRNEGILYIGKSGNVRSRFRGGHKALGWALIDRMDPDDIRIAVATLSFKWIRLSLQLEQIIIRQLLPPYNERIATED